MRAAGGTKSGPPGVVTCATKSRTRDLTAPSFQEGRRSFIGVGSRHFVTACGSSRRFSMKFAVPRFVGKTSHAPCPDWRLVAELATMIRPTFSPARAEAGYDGWSPPVPPKSSTHADAHSVRSRIVKTAFHCTGML